MKIDTLNEVTAMIDQSYLNLLIFGVVWLLANGVGYIALWILSEEVREKPSELDLGLWIFAILIFAFATFLVSLTYPPNSKEYLLAIIAWLLLADVLTFFADLVAFSRYAEEKGWP
jgi:drug/metabolite transporter (DMT)-like permease